MNGQRGLRPCLSRHGLLWVYFQVVAVAGLVFVMTLLIVLIAFRCGVTSAHN